MAGNELKRALAALAIGGASLVLGGAAVGTAVAQQSVTADPTETTRQAPPAGRAPVWRLRGSSFWPRWPAS